MALDARALDHLALLARLELGADERAAFAGQLDRIVHAVDKIGELDLAGIEPTTFAVPLENVLREDLTAPSLPREDALAAAPARTVEGFLVPRVLGGGEG